MNLLILPANSIITIIDIMIAMYIITIGFCCVSCPIPLVIPMAEITESKLKIMSINTI